MSSIRKERWENMHKFLARRINSGHRRCDSTSRRNLHYASGVIRVNNHIITVPRTAHYGALHIAQGLCRAAGDLDFCEFAPGLKSNEPAVGRPEERRYYAVLF